MTMEQENRLRRKVKGKAVYVNKAGRWIKKKQASSPEEAQKAMSAFSQLEHPQKVGVGEPLDVQKQTDFEIQSMSNRLVELRKKSKYSLAALSEYELKEIDDIEKALRKRGITYIGQPSPRRQMYE